MSIVILDFRKFLKDDNNNQTIGGNSVNVKLLPKPLVPFLSRFSDLSLRRGCRNSGEGLADT